MVLFLSSPFYNMKFRNFAELGFGQLWHWKGSSISYLWNGREVYFSWHPRHRFLWRQSREIVLFSSTLCFGFINCTWTINRKSSRYTARASWREWWWYGSGAAFGRTGRINTLTLWREGRRNFSTKMKEDNKNDKFKKQGSVSLKSPSIDWRTRGESRPSDKGGGGHPDLEISGARAVSKKI